MYICFLNPVVVSTAKQPSKGPTVELDLNCFEVIATTVLFHRVAKHYLLTILQVYQKNIIYVSKR